MRKHSRFVLSVLAFGYAFLYIPLVSVIVSIMCEMKA